MNILQLCNKPPYPPLEGGSIAMNNITQGLLAEGHQVKIFAVNSHKYNVTRAQLPEAYIKATNIEFVDIDLRIKHHKAFLNLFTTESYHVTRFVSPDFSKKLTQILTNNCYDVIHIETIFLAPYIPLIRRLSKAPIILRAHNIEHRIWQRLSDNTSSFFKRSYLRHLANTLQKFELNAINQADGIITISKPDMDFFIKNGCKRPISVIPFGVSKELIEQVNPDESLSTNKKGICIGYIGSMNWFPNIEGVKWFIEKVWIPQFSSNPNIQFHLAGRNIPDFFYKYGISNIIIHGEIADAYQYIHDCDIMITPLFSGSGIRIKIIESMLQAKAVITTTIGAEGINYTDKHDIVIANTVMEFIDSILRLSEDSDLRKIVGLNAHELIHLEHNMQLITPQLIAFYKSLATS